LIILVKYIFNIVKQNSKEVDGGKINQFKPSLFHVIVLSFVF